MKTKIFQNIIKNDIESINLEDFYMCERTKLLADAVEKVINDVLRNNSKTVIIINGKERVGISTLGVELKTKLSELKIWVDY